MNYNILFAIKKFSCFIFIAQTKITYSTVSKTRAGIKNFYFFSIISPLSPSSFPQSLNKIMTHYMCTGLTLYISRVFFWVDGQGEPSPDPNIEVSLVNSYHVHSFLCLTPQPSLGDFLISHAYS